MLCFYSRCVHVLNNLLFAQDTLYPTDNVKCNNIIISVRRPHLSCIFLFLFSGMGYASHLIIAFSATSYITIIAWAFFYLFQSFSADLPWATCGHYWNTGRLSCSFWRGLLKPTGVSFIKVPKFGMKCFLLA